MRLCVLHVTCNFFNLQLDDNLVEPESFREELQRQRNTAMWILKLKETRLLPQSTLDGILEDVSLLFTSLIADLSSTLAKRLEENDIDHETILGFTQLFDESSAYCRPFDGLDTRYRQLSFFKEHFNLVVRHVIESGS